MMKKYLLLLCICLVLQGCSGADSGKPVIEAETEQDAEAGEETISEEDMTAEPVDEVVEEVTGFEPIPFIDLSGLHTDTAKQPDMEEDTTPDGEIYDYFDAEALALRYEGEEYYLTREETDYICLVASNQPQLPSGEVTETADDLVRIIKENSATRKRENDTNIFETEYSEVAESSLKKAVKILLETATNDLYHDLCTIREAGLYVGDPAKQYSSWTFAITNQETRDILLYPEAIKRSTDMRGASFEETMTYNILHELNHLRQSLSAEETDAGRTIYSFDYRDGVNTFLKESSAESWLYIYGKANLSTYTYAEEREAEAELLLLSLTNRNGTTDDYYNAIFDNDLTALFQSLHLDSLKDVWHCYRVMYAVDARCRRNDFVKSYFENETENYSLRSAVGLEYKQELFLLFLKKLTEYTVEYEDVSFEECIFLLDLAKCAIINDVYYSAYSEGQEDEKAFLLKMQEYDDKFVAFMSDFYGKPVTRFRTMEKENFPELINSMYRLIDGDEPQSEYDEKASYLLEKHPSLHIILRGDTVSPENMAKLNQVF